MRVSYEKPVTKTESVFPIIFDYKKEAWAIIYTSRTDPIREYIIILCDTEQRVKETFSSMLYIEPKSCYRIEKVNIE